VDFNGAALYPTFTLNFTIDTDRGSLTQGPGLATFDWAAADGLSPLLSGVFDLTIPDSVIDLRAATSISLRNQTSAFSNDYLITLAGPEFALTIVQFRPLTLPNLTQTQTFTGFSLGPGSTFVTAPYDVNFTNTQSFAITNLGPSSAPIPEPSNWVLMIGGFGMAGWGLRRRRSLVVMGSCRGG
jgi:hypothetical protein